MWVGLSVRDCERMNEYSIKSTINHEVHEGYEENTRSINALNLHALHGYFFYIEYFHSFVADIHCKFCLMVWVKRYEWGKYPSGIWHL